MPIETQQQVVEQPIPSGEQVEEAPLSIKEHADLYDAKAPPKAGETPEQAEERRHHALDQRREKTGEFKPGKVRHRAQSQQASPEDVPRIQALTGRAKAAEERAVAAEAEVARLKATHAPPAQIERAEVRAEAAQARVEPLHGETFSEVEPDENDPKFGGDFSKYIRALSGYEGRKAFFEARQAEKQGELQAQRESQQHAALKSFGERMEAAKTKYEDFDTVMAQTVPWLNAQTGQPHPKGVAIDFFVREHAHGADLLYHLQTHPDERDALGRMELVDQMPALSLLLQRFASSPSTQAGTTGSAAGQTPIVLPPKPPNPVRTEAQRTGTSTPPTDGTLSVVGHRKAFNYR